MLLGFVGAVIGALLNQSDLGLSFLIEMLGAAVTFLLIEVAFRSSEQAIETTRRRIEVNQQRFKEYLTYQAKLNAEVHQRIEKLLWLHESESNRNKSLSGLYTELKAVTKTLSDYENSAPGSPQPYQEMRKKVTGLLKYMDTALPTPAADENELRGAEIDPLAWLKQIKLDTPDETSTTK